MRSAYFIALLSSTVLVLMIILLLRHQIVNPDIVDEVTEEAQVTYSFVYPDLGPNPSPILESGSDLYKLHPEPPPCPPTHEPIGNWEFTKGILEDSSLPQPNVTVIQFTCLDGKQQISNEHAPREVFRKDESPLAQCTTGRLVDGLREIDHIVNYFEQRRWGSKDTSPVSQLKDEFIKMNDMSDKHDDDNVTVRTCIQTLFSIQSVYRLEPTKMAQEAYNALPSIFPGNERHFRNFYKHFGTHYMDRAVYGAVYFGLTRNNVTNEVHLGGQNVTDRQSWLSSMEEHPAVLSVTLKPLSRILTGDKEDYGIVGSWMDFYFNKRSTKWRSKQGPWILSVEIP